MTISDHSDGHSPASHLDEETLIAYALDSLDADEAQAAAAHLNDCEHCQEALVSWQEVSGQLALLAPPVEPPTALADQVMAASQAARAPTTDAARQALPADGVRRAAWVPEPPTADRALEPAPRVAVPWLTRAAFALAVLSLVVALGTAGWAISLQRQLSAQTAAQQTTQDTLAVMYSPGMVYRKLLGDEQGAPTAKGRFYMVPTDRTAVFVVEGLPAPQPGRIYQLWLIRDGERASGGLFAVDELGRARFLVQAPLALGTYETIGVTDEPMGGSLGPTGQRRLIGALHPPQNT
ncbi:MAG: hypothetical protein CL878_12105 [Dehalococcoidia bacterium]|nr:hypothetical protein [Dehalococcoidia bacterium]